MIFLGHSYSKETRSRYYRALTLSLRKVTKRLVQNHHHVLAVHKMKKTEKIS